MILDNEGAIFLAQFILDLTANYTKEAEKEKEDPKKFVSKCWEKALTNSINAAAWDNMKKFGRLVEYFDYFRDRI